MRAMLRFLLLFTLTMLAAVLPAMAQARNPFQRSGGAALPVSAVVPGVPPVMIGTRGDEDKLWDSVELVAVSRSLILLRRPGASSSLAVEPGRPFLLAGETWVARLEHDRRVTIFRRDATDGKPVANLWLSGPPARVQGVVQAMPGQPAGGQPAGTQPAAPPVPAGGQTPLPGGVQ